MNENCYFKAHCKKYKNDQCDESFCIKLFKIDKLLDKSLLSERQKSHKALYIDADGTDETAFKQLKDIENNILDFINSGQNLYLHSRNTGNGKTEWSIRLIQAYCHKIWYKSNLECETLFINIPRFLLTLKDILLRYDSIIKFLDSITLDANPQPQSDDMLTISTIHSATDIRCDNTVVYLKNFSDIVDENVYRIALSRANKSEYLIFVNADNFDVPVQYYLKHHLKPI